MKVRNSSEFDGSSLKTEKQWAKEYKTPKADVSGTRMYANGMHQDIFTYYTQDEVEDMSEEEISAIKELAKAKRIEKRKKIEALREQELIDTKNNAEMKGRRTGRFDLGHELIARSNRLPSIPCENETKLIVLDVETTGLGEEQEVLQISIIDGNGKELLNTYVKPYYHVKWSDAQMIHGIAPDMVEDAPYPHELIPVVKGIFESAERIMIYNATFDLGYMADWGIKPSEHQVVDDVMIEFAEIYGEWNDYYHEFKWQKLTTAAHYYGFEFGAHNSLEDVRATLFTYYAIKAEAPRYEWHRYLVIDDGENTVYEANNVTEMVEKAREIYGPLWNSHVIRATKNGLDLLAYKDAKPKAVTNMATLI